MQALLDALALAPLGQGAGDAEGLATQVRLDHRRPGGVVLLKR